MNPKLNLVITGLPRSGTSLLCARINSFDNAAVINEPQEVFAELRGGSIDGLQRIFGKFRSDIEQGKPVYNKIKDGKFIEDTRLEDSRSLHLHEALDDNFLLGIKNTLVFLAMLPDITRSRVFPKVLASIRHPYDCIASWHSVSFPHLQQAKPDFMLNYATGIIARRLPEVLAEDEIYARSARLWVLLAQALLAAQGSIQVLRYEDMVTKPERAYQKIGEYLGFEIDREQRFSPSKPVRRGKDLTDEQKATIASACKKVAIRFGYKLD